MDRRDDFLYTVALFSDVIKGLGSITVLGVFVWAVGHFVFGAW